MANARPLVECVTGVSPVVIATDWAEFVDPVVLVDLVAARRVIDGRNCLDAAQWARAGWLSRGTGRPPA